MNNYKYSLQKYSGRNSRHTCPACRRPHCFTYYADAAGNPLANDVGRCEHLFKCGYHKTPAQYFAEHPQERERKEYRPALPQCQQKEVRTDYIPFSLIQRSESTRNTLMYYLSKFFHPSNLERVTKMYHLGSTKLGETIYPQIDTQGRCRTGKVMKYGEDGHRIKRSEYDAVDWLHARLMRQQGRAASDYHLQQCLFGEHLLPQRPNDVVCLVESEKSAVIASLVFPDSVWIAVGGKAMFSPERCKVLAGRDVLIYSDADAVEEWGSKIKFFTFCHSIRLSDWAQDEPEGSKRDIADLIMNERKPLSKPTTIGDVCQWIAELNIPKGRITFNV